MIKYARIINEETKEVQVGVGCPDEYYIEIGMTEMEVEQAYNGNWYVAGYAPVEPQPTIEERNEIIRQTRAGLYSQLVDPLHAEKQRKVILEEWTEEMETEYVAKVKELTEQIQTENPYIETVD